MLNCSKCGSLIPDDSLFCTECGAAVVEEKPKAQDIKQDTIETVQKSTVEKQNVSQMKKAGKTGTASTVAIVILSLFLATLAVLSISLFTSLETVRAEKQSLLLENDSLNKANSRLQTQKEMVETERDAARAKLKETQKIATNYEGVADWLKEHGTEYNANKKYRAATNVVVVRVGETYDLEITYVGDRYIWKGNTNNHTKANWTKQWSDNKTHVRITGASVGTSEISFSLGDKNKADPNVSFRVLVIVVL